MGRPINSTTPTPRSSTKTFISIIPNEPLMSTTTTTTQRPGQTTTTRPSNQIKTTVRPSPTKTSTTTTLGSSQMTSQTTTTTTTVGSRIPLLSCQPTGEHSQVEAWYEGMVAWCDHNCNHDPAHCPQSH